MQGSNESTSILTLPRDVWGVIVQYIHRYDAIFVRATSKWLNKLCKEFRPFPRFHVLDQDSCMDYLIENGLISLLDYVKDVLHFEWASRQCSTAIKFGHVNVLSHLRANGCPFDSHTALRYCTRGTCSLDMIKYLIESGVTWRHAEEKPTQKYLLHVSDMARHGHTDCIKYALQNGCEDRASHYTPSIECLDLLINNKFEWKDRGNPDVVVGLKRQKYSICEEAAMKGDIIMLKYAHQKGAPLLDAANYAAKAGHLVCLTYALENAAAVQTNEKWDVRSIECFNYLVKKIGLPTLQDKINLVGASSNATLMKHMLDNGIALLDSDLSHRLLLLCCAELPDTLTLLLDRIPKESINSFNLIGVCARTGIIDSMKIILDRNIFSEQKQHDVQQNISNAIHSKNIQMMKLVWDLYPNKETVDMDMLLSITASSSTPEILNFLIEQGAKPTRAHLQMAVGNLPNLAYLTLHGCQGNDPPLSIQHSKCVKYAREHGLKVEMSKSK